MSSFSITRKKTPFQKHREEEEAKKKVLQLISLSLSLSWWGGDFMDELTDMLFSFFVVESGG